MPYNIELAERFRQALATVESVEERNMFGSLGFMVNKKLAVCVRKDSVMYRLGAERAAEAVSLSYVEQMTMNNRKMTDWVYITNEHLQNAADFNTWLKSALEYNTSAAEE